MTTYQSSIDTSLNTEAIGIIKEWCLLDLPISIVAIVFVILCIPPRSKPPVFAEINWPMLT